MLSDLTDARLNDYLDQGERDGLSARTVKNHRAGLLSLWRAAFTAGRVSQAPERVRVVQFIPPHRAVWTPDDIRRLLVHVATIEDIFRLSRVPKAFWWRALILCGWDTGLTLGQLYRLKKSQLQVDGRLTIVSGISGKPVTCELRPETIEAVLALIRADKELIFAGNMRQGHFSTHWAKLVAAVGLKGDFRMIRYSAATALENERPGSADAFLGHRTPQLALVHSQIDREQLHVTKPLSPSLLEGGAA